MSENYPRVEWSEAHVAYDPFWDEEWFSPAGWVVFLNHYWVPGPVFGRKEDAEIGLRTLMEAGVNLDDIEGSLQTLFPNKGDVTKCMCEHLQW